MGPEKNREIMMPNTQGSQGPQSKEGKPLSPYDTDQLKTPMGKLVTVWFSAQVALKGTIESVERYTFTLAATEKIAPNGNYAIRGPVEERLCVVNKSNYWFITTWQ